MTESESVALPLGDTPLTNAIITDIPFFVKSFFKNFSAFLFLFNIPGKSVKYTDFFENSPLRKKSADFLKKIQNPVEILEKM